MKVKIFEKTWTSGLGTLEREINNFLATLPPGAVLNTQTTTAAVRNDSDQTVTEYLVAIVHFCGGRRTTCRIHRSVHGSRSHAPRGDGWPPAVRQAARCRQLTPQPPSVSGKPLPVALPVRSSGWATPDAGNGFFGCGDRPPNIAAKMGERSQRQKSGK